MNGTKKMDCKIIGWLCFVLMGMCLLTGCYGVEDRIAHGTDNGDKYGDIAEEIEVALYDKYGILFCVESVEEVNGRYAFSGTFYQAQVTPESEFSSFTAVISKDGGSVIDDYPRIIYDENIHELVQEAFDVWEADAEYSFQVHYALEEQNWQKEDELQDYLENSDTYIMVELELRDMESEDAADSVYDLCMSLQECVQFNMTCDYQGKKIYIVDDNVIELMSYDEVKEKFTGE